jgi:hypothetical protein
MQLARNLGSVFGATELTSGQQQLGVIHRRPPEVLSALWNRRTSRCPPFWAYAVSPSTGNSTLRTFVLV